MAEQNKDLNKYKDVVGSMPETQAYLLGKTVQNISRGAYWSFVSEKELLENINEKEVESLGDVVSIIRTGSYEDKEPIYLIQYSRPTDMFDLMKKVNPEASASLDQALDRISGEVQQSNEAFVAEMPAKYEKLAKKVHGGEVVMPLGILSLNKSKTVEVKSQGLPVKINAYQVTLDDLLYILAQLQQAYGVQAYFENPETLKTFSIEDEDVLEAFVRSNKNISSGLWTLIHFG